MSQEHYNLANFWRGQKGRYNIEGSRHEGITYIAGRRPEKIEQKYIEQISDTKEKRSASANGHKGSTTIYKVEPSSPTSQSPQQESRKLAAG